MKSTGVQGGVQGSEGPLAARDRPVRESVRIASWLVAYAVVIVLSKRLLSDANLISLLWPPSGIALAGMLLESGSRARLWVGFFAAHWAANIVVGTPPLLAMGFATASALEIGVGAFAMLKVRGPNIRFERVGDIVALFGVAVLVNGMTATVGAFGSAVASGGGFAGIWLTWWISDALGLTLITPVLVCGLTAIQTRDLPTRRELLEALLLVVLLCLTAAAQSMIELRGGWHFYAALPLLTWSGLRLGVKGTAAACLWFTALTLTTLILGDGQVEWQSDEMLKPRLLRAQAFLVLTCLLGLTLAAVVGEQHRTASALRNREELFRSLIQASPVAIFLVRDFRIEHPNRRFGELFEVDLEEVPGMLMQDLSPPRQPDGSSSAARMRSCLANAERGEQRRFTWCYRRRSGETLQAETDLLPVTLGNESFVLCMLRDVTRELEIQEERRRLDEQVKKAQQLDALGRLAGGVAHDLNNMLMPIVGNADVLLEDLEGDQRDEVAEIIAAAERARDLVSNLLAFGRRQALASGAVELNELMRSMKGLLRSMVPDDVVLELDPGGECYVRADARQIEQILMNFVINAADAMPNGGRVAISTSIVEIAESERESFDSVSAGAYARLVVSDHGHGMTPEILAQLFEPFFSTKGDRGTGLGLASSYGIAKQHRGGIRVQSEVGRGSTFELLLPFCDEPVRASRPVDPTYQRPPASETVLVAEDDPMVRLQVFRALGRAGFNVLEAPDGAAAVDEAAAFDGRIDLLVTDAIMPRMNGKALYERLIRERRTLKVLYISGYSDDVLADRGVLPDGIALLKKPFSQRELLAKVYTLLATPVSGSSDTRTQS